MGEEKEAKKVKEDETLEARIERLETEAAENAGKISDLHEYKAKTEEALKKASKKLGKGFFDW